MKKQMLKFGLLGLTLVLSTVLFYSCRKNTSDYVQTGPQFTNTEMTTATFLGQVVKEDGTPLDGATVSTGTNMMTTDADGFFYFSNINTPKNATLIKIEKAGYFKAFRTVRVIANQDNQVRIMAMELPTPQVFSSGSGGTVTISNGGSIDFPANAIVDATTGQPYNGSVSVLAKWIDPSSGNLPLLVPGDLRGINEEGEEEGLTTYGMQAVELYGNSGQALQLGNGQQATVTFPLPASHATAAPNTVPLWHFDEAQGMWVEEGQAVKNGTEYKGDVSHFSFWNCDYGGPIVQFSCTLVDGSSNPISGATVELDPTSSSVWTGYGITNSSGVASGGIPVNTTFDLNYIPSGCPWGSPSTYVQSFSSTTSNVNLGNISVTNTSSPATVSGSVEDCNAVSLSNAPVKLKIGTQILATTTNASGQFTFNVNCVTAPTSAVVTAYDVTTNVNGSTNITITPSTTTNTGTVAACGTQNDFITIDVTNPPATTPTTYSIVEPSGNFTQFYQLETGISGYDNSGPLLGFQVSFGFDGPQTVAGTHNLTRYLDGNDSIATYTPTLVNLTSYGAVGGKISGSFTTTVTGSQVYNAALINCNFRVTRQQ